MGNFPSVKGLGAGVLGCKLDFRLGYRIYFCKDGDRLVILVGGGTKRRQSKDIEVAQERDDSGQGAGTAGVPQSAIAGARGVLSERGA